LSNLKPILAIWLLFALLMQFDALRRLELFGFDLLTRMSTPATVKAPVVIVGIDEFSFAELQLQWPWPRGLHAELIDQIMAAGASAVALDILFAEPSIPEEDRRLAEAVRRSGKVVLASDVVVQETAHYRAEVMALPIPELLDAGAYSGAAGVNLDADLVVRRIPQVDDAFWRRSIEAAGLEPVPVDGERLARYLGPDHRFPYVSYYQALDPETFLPPGILKDKIILVGYDSKASLGEEGVDAYATPYSSVTGRLTPGVELHATFIANALNGSAIREVSQTWALAVTGLALLVAGLAMRNWQPLRGALISATVMATVVLLAVWLFQSQGLWLPVAMTLLAVTVLYVGQLITAFVRERLLRRRLRAMFSRYVSPNRVAYLVEHPESLELGGIRRECSFVFTDLAGFTSLMESIGPEEAVSLLNGYLDRMIAIAFEHDGTLDRVVGDALAILFSAPVEQADHRQRALDCALDMLRFSESYAAEAQARGCPFGHTRVGVHTGEVTIGNFGGQTMFDYRALGDPVNTAARLESVNKQLGTRICVSEATLSGCTGIATRPVGQLVLKGKSQAVMAYQPLSDGPDADYEQAYEALDSEPAIALARFQTLAEARPDDGLVRFQRQRLEAGQTGSRIAFSEK